MTALINALWPFAMIALIGACKVLHWKYRYYKQNNFKNYNLLREAKGLKPIEQ